jgi:hypothetical protein
MELSGGDLVLGREAAEDLSSAGPVPGEVDLRQTAMSVSGCQLAQGAVRPGGAVVRQVLGQYLAQVALADDQQPAGDFAPQGRDDRFADGVRCGCLRRAGQNRDAGRQEDGAGPGGELAGAVPDQECGSSPAGAGFDQEVTGGLGRLCAAGVRGDTGQAGAAGAVFDGDRG